MTRSKHSLSSSSSSSSVSQPVSESQNDGSNESASSSSSSSSSSSASASSDFGSPQLLVLLQTLSSQVAAQNKKHASLSKQLTAATATKGRADKQGKEITQLKAALARAEDALKL